MNVKLSYELDFPVIIVDDSKLLANSYNLKMNLITATENNYHQNIAFQRILFFIREIFENSILIHSENPNLIDILKLFENNHYCILPEEPYDQAIGYLLFHKLSAITEGKLEIENIIISSDLSDGVMYTIDDFNIFESTEDKNSSKLLWWDRSDITTADGEGIPANISWEDIDLSWDSPLETDVPDDVELVFTPEKKSTTPSIIVLDGGKELVPEDNNVG